MKDNGTIVIGEEVYTPAKVAFRHGSTTYWVNISDEFLADLGKIGLFEFLPDSVEGFSDAKPKPKGNHVMLNFSNVESESRPTSRVLYFNRPAVLEWWDAKRPILEKQIAEAAEVNSDASRLMNVLKLAEFLVHGLYRWTTEVEIKPYFVGFLRQNGLNGGIIENRQFNFLKAA